MKYCIYLNYEGIIWEANVYNQPPSLFVFTLISLGVVYKQLVLDVIIESTVLWEAMITEQLQLQITYTALLSKVWMPVYCLPATQPDSVVL